MSNIISSQNTINNNAIAAQKLSDKKTGSRKDMGLINLPANTYKYSSDEYVKEMEEIRKEASRERIKREQREAKAKKFNSLIKAAAFCSCVYIFIKNVNLNKFFK